jgi:hypothetical protein
VHVLVTGRCAGLGRALLLSDCNTSGEYERDGYDACDPLHVIPSCRPSYRRGLGGRYNPLVDRRVANLRAALGIIPAAVPRAGAPADSTAWLGW